MLCRQYSPHPTALQLTAPLLSRSFTFVVIGLDAIVVAARSCLKEPIKVIAMGKANYTGDSFLLSQTRLPQLQRHYAV